MIKKVLLLTCCVLFSAQSVSASELWDFYENYSDEYKANTHTIENVSHRIVEALTSGQSEEDIKKALLFQTSRCLSPEVDPSAEVLQKGIAALKQLGSHNSALSSLSTAGLAALEQIPENNPWARFNILSILANAARIYEVDYAEESDKEQSEENKSHFDVESCISSDSHDKILSKNSSLGSSGGKKSTSDNSGNQ